MKASIVPNSIQTLKRKKRAFPARLLRRGLLNRLAALQHGQVNLKDDEGCYRFGEPTEEFPHPVTIKVNSSEFYTELALGGSVGAGEAYIHGLWSCDDLTLLTRIMVRNQHVIDGMDSSLSRFKAPLHQLLHWFNRNTKKGSRRNIASHYDLGNELFSLFLDPTMMYSSAIFENDEVDLEQASVAKLDRICQKLDLQASDHVLEIGTGWGGFAIHAAKHYGCRVTTTTISREQFEYASRRIVEEGLQDSVTLLMEDYRDLQGQYDKMVSIEMIEAIGYQYLGVYFATCDRLLKPRGMMLLQAITIADQRYEQARRSVDFIKRFIFPGGFLPSVSAMADALARNSDMRIYHLDDIGPHYATTVRKWRQRFFQRIKEVKALGYPESFIRMWEFYLCYCEGGFEERAIGTAQLLLIKPENKRAPLTSGL